MSRLALGLTVIEVVVVLVVLSVGAISILGALRGGATGAATAADTSTGGLLAAQKLDAILADRRNGLRGYTYVTSANYPGESGLVIEPGGAASAYARSVTIADASTSASCRTTLGCKLVTVTVTRSGATVAASELLLQNY